MENMRQLLPIIALSLLISQNLHAQSRNCLVILVGGAKEWNSLLSPRTWGKPNDISVDVDRVVSLEAKRTGCKVISGSNQNYDEFSRMIKTASKPPYFTSGTTVHISLNDHGNSQFLGPDERSLVIGNGKTIMHSSLNNLLRESFPKGARLTTSSSICFGSTPEFPFHFNLDGHFDICGSASTHPEKFSYNSRNIERYAGRIHGPYSGVGLAAAADRAAANRNLSLNEYHQVAKRGDLGNIHKLPGFLTSVAFARHVLLKKKVKVSLDSSPFMQLLERTPTTEKIEQTIANFNNSKVYNQILKIMNQFGDCPNPGPDPVLKQFFQDFSDFFKTLELSEMEKLPEPMKTQARVANNFLNNNKNGLTKMITSFLKGKVSFWARMKAGLSDPSQSRAIISEWDKERTRLTAGLSRYLFNMRSIQEAKTIQKFLSIATPEERDRYMKFVKCESRPVI
jgi:hypothetical protein